MRRDIYIAVIIVWVGAFLSGFFTGKLMFDQPARTTPTPPVCAGEDSPSCWWQDPDTGAWYWNDTNTGKSVYER